MTDSTWDDYTAEDVPAEAVADIVPILDVAETDAGQADAAASWGDWNQEIADDAAVDAAAEISYADQAYADGFEGAGDSAMNRAGISLDTAESHGETAGDYDATADSEAASALDGYASATEIASDAVDMASVDTSYDAISYDTTADTSSDAGAADSGYAADDAG